MAGLTPFAAGARGAWGVPEARHLLDRAGLGGTPEQVRELAGLGLDAAVTRLCRLGPAPAEPVPAFLNVTPPDPQAVRAATEAERRRLFQDFQRAQKQGAGALKGWWMERLVSSPRAFEEKLTLFWHGHFATEVEKVKNPRLMYDQNVMLRRLGQGKFRDLLLGVSRDPAMLIYLDNHLNVKSHPNENYARELFELFSLGIGNYTEKDIQESARAFTGWSLSGGGRRGTKGGGDHEAEFEFKPAQHDTGSKTILGRTGNLDGSDVVDIILHQPCTAAFLAGKLWRFYVHDTVAPEDEPHVAALADELRRSDYHVGPTLETLFRSQAFYEPRHRAARIKSPIELIAGTMRSMGWPATGQVAFFLCQAAGNLGQELFDPPNVAGWAGGQTWINTSTLLGRYNLCDAMINGGPLRRQRQETRPPLPKLQAKDPANLVAEVCARWLAAPLAPAQQGTLAQMAQDQWIWGVDETIRGILHLVMSTPNYQLV